MEWQSLETAPKDEYGSLDPILLSCIGDSAPYVDAGFWDTAKNRWVSATNHDGYEHSELSPVGWMRMPEPLTDT